MKAVKLSVVSAAVLLSTSAMANVVTNTGAAVVDGTRTIFSTLVKPAAVSAEVGTLGYGANIAWDANDSTAVVAGWTGGDISISDKLSVNDVKYDVETDLSNPYLGVQVRPMKNWLTVNTGIIIPDNTVTVTAKPDSEIKIAGTTYTNTEVESLTGTVKNHNKVAPYLTVGFRPTINNNWGVFGEVGAAYTGKVDADLTGTGTKGAEAAEKARQEIESEAALKWAPIAKLGVTYRF